MCSRVPFSHCMKYPYHRGIMAIQDKQKGGTLKGGRSICQSVAKAFRLLALWLQALLTSHSFSRSHGMLMGEPVSQYLPPL